MGSSKTYYSLSSGVDVDLSSILSPRVAQCKRCGKVVVGDLAMKRHLRSGCIPPPPPPLPAPVKVDKNLQRILEDLVDN